MHVGIANPQWRGNVPGIPGACATRNFAYLAWSPCSHTHTNYLGNFCYRDQFLFASKWFFGTQLLIHTSNPMAFWINNYWNHDMDEWWHFVFKQIILVTYAIKSVRVWLIPLTIRFLEKPLERCFAQQTPSFQGHGIWWDLGLLLLTWINLSPSLDY